MKNIIIVLFRSELNYLIKYDRLRTSSDRIIHLSYNEFENLSEDRQVNLLQNAMPIYEQEHEVLLIEYNRFLEYDNAPLLKFSGIRDIIPISDTGSRLLSSKLNNDFKIAEPLNPSIYRSFTNYRSHIIRNEAGNQLCSIYKLEVPKEDFITDFKAATLFQLNNQSPGNNDSTLAHLVDFNTTPSFIPEGNIEAIIKSACVGMKKTGIDIEKTKISTFYKFVLENKEKINGISFYQALQHILETIGQDVKIGERFNELKNLLSENGKREKAFTIYSYFYFLKKQIEKNDYDISSIKEDVLELKYYDSISASKVLFMLGYTFSIQTISKSLQSFSSTPLMKTTKSLNLDWTPEVLEEITSVEPENIPLSIEIDKTDVADSLNNQNKYESDNENPIVIPLSVNEEKDISVKFNSNLVPHNEQSPGVNLSTQNTSEVIDESIESGKNKHNEMLNKTGYLFTSEIVDNSSNNKSSHEQELCNLDDFRKSIGTGKFAESVMGVLKLKVDANEEFSKQTLIICLKEIDQYQTKSGTTSSNAKKALKIFDKDE